MNTTAREPTAAGPAPPRRRRRWLRWLLIGVAALVVLLVGAVVVSVKLASVPAPLALPANAAPPVGPIDGTWSAGPGSTAGFRIEQTVIGASGWVVGRTDGVTGTVTVAGGSVTGADLRVDLGRLTSNGKPAPQFDRVLETDRYPDATISLARPVTPDAAFASGAATTVDATGQVTLHGTTRPVPVPLSVRRDGAAIRVAGAFPVAFADWGIEAPRGYGWFGSLANHGTAEFLLVLQRA